MDSVLKSGTLLQFCKCITPGSKVKPLTKKAMPNFYDVMFVRKLYKTCSCWDCDNTQNVLELDAIMRGKAEDVELRKFLSWPIRREKTPFDTIWNSSLQGQVRIQPRKVITSWDRSATRCVNLKVVQLSLRSTIPHSAHHLLCASRLRESRTYHSRHRDC